jgi:hypothetical protein
LIATLTQCEEDGDVAAPRIPAFTTSTTDRAEETEDVGRVSPKEMVGSVGYGLFDEFDGLDFDECLN